MLLDMFLKLKSPAGKSLPIHVNTPPSFLSSPAFIRTGIISPISGKSKASSKDNGISAAAALTWASCINRLSLSITAFSTPVFTR